MIKPLLFLGTFLFMATMGLAQPANKITHVSAGSGNSFTAIQNYQPGLPSGGHVINADQSGNNNSLNINQQGGTFNVATANQAGNDNKAVVTTNGFSQSATVTQDGDQGQAVIKQLTGGGPARAYMNVASITTSMGSTGGDHFIEQGGLFNNALIVDDGANNTSKISQINYRNNDAQIVYSGTNANNTTKIEQDGTLNVANVTQQGTSNGNGVSIKQEKLRNTAIVELDGTNETVEINQGGKHINTVNVGLIAATGGSKDNVYKFNQTGAHNTANLFQQDAVGNEMTINQSNLTGTSNTNLINIELTGDFNTHTFNQTGENNMQIHNISGNNNVGTYTQTP